MSAPTSASHATMQIHRPPEAGPGLSLLAPSGAQVVLGQGEAFAASINPDRHTLFGPRGACLMADGSLYIADTGHHRLLGYRTRPTRDYAPADFVIGQPDFTSEGRNALSEPGPTSLNVPTGVAAYGAGGLAVADAWNNRVLIWHERPMADNVPADVVLGQADFNNQDPNRGSASADAHTLHWPFAVLVHRGRLYVADAGNRRVLVWRTLPAVNGQPADFALGQPNLQERSDNAGLGAGAASMRWPHDLAILQRGGRDHLIVADAGNNRVMLWDGLPDAMNAPAHQVLGQADFGQVEHNRSRYWPTADGLNMPYAVASHGGLLAVADTANSRLLGFMDCDPTGASGRAATHLTGQPSFAHKGDNRWAPPCRDSLCWPYGLQLADGLAVIADSGNNRVLLWPLAAPPAGPAGCVAPGEDGG